ncbi:MerR family transcriptional regulator [Rubripirellula sp.]|nr:MerR family transcriptional regulator [Rubripirellula sp.]MDB4338740.1 MerR family transcriptional regulator [Rubripirellula sp.]
MVVEGDGADLDLLAGRRIALVGRFGGMNQKQAANVLRSYNAVVVDQDDLMLNWIVIGAEESPLAEAELLNARVRDAAARGEVEVVHESELWQRLGLVDIEQAIRRYYTPAMLAHLLNVSVHVIRRWQRRGLITPVRTLHRLPYFDFQEIATARRLAQWIASGASPKAIEQRLVDLVEVLPHLQRPLDQLSILVEGSQVFLRQGEGLLEPNGQLRFDFDSLDHTTDGDDDQEIASARPSLSIFEEPPDIVPFRIPTDLHADDLLDAAFEAEESGDLGLAIDYCHAILARDGPRPDVDFQLGELLYRSGEIVAARERFYSATEADPEFVEARMGLGCVLQETSQIDLALAAFRGALALHEDYSEAHYHLANLLDELGREEEGRHHWDRFLQLAPDSPWARQAMERLLQQEAENLDDSDSKNT